MALFLFGVEIRFWGAEGKKQEKTHLGKNVLELKGLFHFLSNFVDFSLGGRY